MEREIPLFTLTFKTPRCKMKKLGLCLTLSSLIIIFCIPTLGIMLSSNDEIIEIDNRRISQFPEFNKKFLKNFSSYIGDRLLFKEFFAQNFYGAYSSHFYEDGMSSNIVIGLDDWLFLGNHYNSVVSKHTKALKIDDSKLANYIERLKQIEQEFDPDRFLLVIVPDKLTIYNEYFPIPISDQNRFIDRLIPYLNSQFEVVDLSSDLLKFKKYNEFLYYKDDSHWNNLGAYVGFNTLLGVLNESKLKLNFVPGQHVVGDLATIKGGIRKDATLYLGDTWKPILENRNIDVKLSHQPSTIYKLFDDAPLDITSRKYGPAIIFSNKRARLDKTIILFTDSTGKAFTPFATLVFKNVIWVDRYRDLQEVLSAINLSNLPKPDVAVYLSVERLVGDQE